MVDPRISDRSGEKTGSYLPCAGLSRSRRPGVPGKSVGLPLRNGLVLGLAASTWAPASIAPRRRPLPRSVWIGRWACSGRRFLDGCRQGHRSHAGQLEQVTRPTPCPRYRIVQRVGQAVRAIMPQDQIPLGAADLAGAAVGLEVGITPAHGVRGVVTATPLKGSRRCRRIGFPFIEAGWFTQTGHYFGHQNAAISEGEALAAVVRSLSETRAETGSREILLPSMRVSSSRAEPSRPANGAPHERGEYGGSDPPFLAASAAQRGG